MTRWTKADAGRLTEIQTLLEKAGQNRSDEVRAALLSTAHEKLAHLVTSLWTREF